MGARSMALPPGWSARPTSARRFDGPQGSARTVAAAWRMHDEAQAPPPAHPLATVGPPTAAEPPPPTLDRWEPLPGGRLKGYVYGSSLHKDGTEIHTARVMEGELREGAVVSTATGSRYSLY